MEPPEPIQLYIVRDAGTQEVLASGLLRREAEMIAGGYRYDERDVEIKAEGVIK